MDELIKDLLKRIEGREFQPGSLIPSSRELAAHYDLSLSTIHRPVATLREYTSRYSRHRHPNHRTCSFVLMVGRQEPDTNDAEKGAG
jgi:DNA-binding transcriptional MocR family regulator